MYLLIDLETTGLDPNGDAILEAAFLVRYPDLTGEHIPHNWLIEPTVDTRRIIAETMNPIVLQMHSDNGLLADLDDPDKSKLSLAEVEQNVLDLLAEYDKITGDEEWYLTGSSVSFDKSFLAIHMPRLHEKLHYRILDVSSVKLFLDVAGQTLSESQLDKNPHPHRASYDLLDSLRYLHRAAGFVSNAADIMANHPDESDWETTDNA